MSTVEILIVFSALMALVSLVAVGLDWIGKPLKHRRFIPRMYRFEDEKLPVDPYGHTSFDLAAPAPAAMPPVVAPPVGYPPQPAPVVVATIPPAEIRPAAASATVAVPVVPEQADDEADADATERAPAARRSGSTSAFSDSLKQTTSGSTPAVPGGAALSSHSLIAGSSAIGLADRSAREWNPSMPLDATIDDRKPNLAAKAQRFWRATAASLTTSHFDSDNMARMRDGKPPRRTNPRTGRTETMQLTGLRAATQPDDVRMTWPDDSIDPWS